MTSRKVNECECLCKHLAGVIDMALNGNNKSESELEPTSRSARLVVGEPVHVI